MKTQLVSKLSLIIISIFIIFGCNNDEVQNPVIHYIEPDFLSWGTDSVIYLYYTNTGEGLIDFYKCNIQPSGAELHFIYSFKYTPGFYFGHLDGRYCSIDTSVIILFKHSLYKLKLSTASFTELTGNGLYVWDLGYYNSYDYKFTFTANNNSAYDLFLMNYDGSGIVNLTNDTVKETVSGILSPESKVIYWADGHIHSVNFDGSDKHDLSGIQQGDTITHWRPIISNDNLWIFYIQYDLAGKYLCRMKTDGSEKSTVTSDTMFVYTYYLTNDNNRLVLVDNGKIYELTVSPYTIYQVNFCNSQAVMHFSPFVNSVIYRIYETGANGLYMCRNYNEKILLAPQIIK